MKTAAIFPTETVQREGQAVQGVVASGRPQVDGVRPPSVPRLPQRPRPQLDFEVQRSRAARVQRPLASEQTVNLFVFLAVLIRFNPKPRL